MYSSTKSLEYILLSNFEQKTAFLAIYKPKRERNRPFFAIFVYSGSLEGLFDFYDPLHHHPQAGHSPRQYSVPQFRSRPQGLSLFLSVGTELLTSAAA